MAADDQDRQGAGEKPHTGSISLSLCPLFPPLKQLCSTLWSFSGSLPLLLPSSLLQTVCAIRFYLAVVFLGGFFLFLALTCSVFHHPAFPGSHSYAHPPASFAWFSVALPPLFCLAFSSSPSALSLSATVSRIAT